MPKLEPQTRNKKMSALKKLASQTAIYGLPSILGRFLNYLLVPLYTNTVYFTTSEYGVITDVYAICAFAAVLLLYGMETAFFRFSEKSEQPKTVLGTTLTAVFITTLAFFVVLFSFTDTLADWLKYPNNPEYVIWAGLFLGFDALSAIPMANLRRQGKAITFAAINLSNILSFIGFNLVFIYFGMMTVKDGGSNFITENIIDPEIGLAYVFVANVLASGIKLILLIPSYKNLNFKLDVKLLKQMVLYASPLIIAGFAGIINETIDRRLLRVILEPELGYDGALSETGIYGACYKLSIIITLTIQAFRYAAEPFFFEREKHSGAKEMYSKIMTWFSIFLSVIFLVVMLYIDAFKLFIRTEKYWVGLGVVPILMLANIFLGWIVNLSIWYKLSNKTHYGALISIVGAVITLVVNFLLIPKYSYMGAAWATFAAYGTMAVLSYILGQKHYPIPYNLLKILGYTGLSVTLWWISTLIDFDNSILKYITKSVFLTVFLGIIYLMERNQLKQLIVFKK